MVTDHDPDDEDRRELVDFDVCPFCGDRVRWQHAWKVAVMAPPTEPIWSAFESAPLDAPIYDEVLVVCGSIQCKDAAREFAIAHRRPFGQKQAMRERRAWERKAGYLP